MIVPGSRRSPVRVIAAIALVLAGTTACSGDDSAGGSGPTTEPPTSATTSPGPTEPPEPIESSTSPTTGGDTTAASTPGTNPFADGTTTTTDGAPGPATDDADERGVPGLESDELVCRSWSRFAGTFQVVAVTAAFGEGGSIDVAELEVAAAPVVTAAYDELLTNWPDELAEEESDVAEFFLGPFARRSARALDALEGAGAGPETIDALAAAWLEALADRDPASPVFVLDLDPELRAVVESAAATFDAAVPPVPADPSLVSDVTVPQTEAYLAAECPDRGALGGTEVEP